MLLHLMLFSEVHNVIAGLITINNSATLEIHNLTLRDGRATRTQTPPTITGGAIQMYSGYLQIYDSKLESNRAVTQGGAINILGGSVHIERSILSSNTALYQSPYTNANGGAINHNMPAGSSFATICTRFDSNQASNLGGAVYLNNGTNVTFNGNNSFWSNITISLIGKHIYNGGTPDADVTNNWWVSTPVSPGDINNLITVNPLAPGSGDPAQDPTRGFATGNYYGSNEIPPQPAFPCQMKKPQQTLIEELATYGIAAYYPSSFGTVPGASGTARQWTADELMQVVAGVQDVAAAFNKVKENPSEGTTEQAKTLFKIVMGTASNQLQMLRVENGFTVITGQEDSCNNAYDKGCTSNDNNFIAFYGNVIIVEYTVAHELGHRFDGQSRIGHPSLSNRIDGQGIVIKDCVGGEPEGARVMGRYLSEINWERGQRGWGSAPPTTPPSEFQQNWMPGTDDVEISETSADMFLNWVYRKLTDPTDTEVNPNPCLGPITGNWQGFRNIDGSGAADFTLPGNARYWWIDDEIRKIFAEHIW